MVEDRNIEMYICLRNRTERRCCCEDRFDRKILSVFSRPAPPVHSPRQQRDVHVAISISIARSCILGFGYDAMRCKGTDFSSALALTVKDA